jgi:protein-tyrosine phosphatase
MPLLRIDFGSYGGKRAFARTMAFTLAARSGFAYRYQTFDPARVHRLVFVCKGNICRSPFAGAVATRLGLSAISCGLDARKGASADPLAMTVAAEYGIDLSRHFSRAIGDILLTESDLIVGFEPWHVRTPTGSQGSEPGPQISLLGAWTHPPSLYIHDPYGTNERCFRRSFGLIQQAVERLASRLIA